VRANSQATCSPDSWPELGNGGGSPARGPRRRERLASKAWVLLSAPRRRARSDLFGSLALAPGKSDPPQRVEPQEGATVEADRLIPTDSATPGGKDLRCAVFIAVVARARMSE
jgi:hypothetical protein